MSNQAKAAEVIDRHGFDPCREPECIAQDLADAGLLAPDLPEPDVRDTIDWWTRLASVLLNEDGEQISIIFDNHWVNAPSPSHVRELGLALLAAANYQEKA
ncbi:MAG: hypothetical protein E6Y04_08315 [Corynebacterium sp.]|uniref:hypothetical protein n=1 Tax=Corynebacterium sp. TaxID=1720 RepID=UPI0029083FCA|nr:hypothetical protein [Corynebacterium sp.]MDU4729959.1 hypothetical protein [Corynebacterium sp.]